MSAAEWKRGFAIRGPKGPQKSKRSHESRGVETGSEQGKRAQSVAHSIPRRKASTAHSAETFSSNIKLLDSPAPHSMSRATSRGRTSNTLNIGQRRRRTELKLANKLLLPKAKTERFCRPQGQHGPQKSPNAGGLFRSDNIPFAMLPKDNIGRKSGRKTTLYLGG